MTPMQQMFLGVGAKKKTYIDDVYNTFIYKGNSGSQTINNGINFSGEGGLLWIKNRSDSSTQNILTDTVRGANKVLYSDANNAETATNMNQSFNNNGWSMNCNFGDINQSNKDYVAHSLRKAPGFFEILTWTGNYQNNHQISHSLGSVPGFIIIKRTSATENWTCLHRDMSIDGWIDFDQDSAGGTGYSGLWNDVRPTATHLNLGANVRVNGNGDTYVGYLFAGGESPAATARSVGFNGTNSWLTIADHADFDVGTNWTAECWFRCNAIGSNGWDVIMGQWTGAWVLEYVGTDLRFYYDGGASHKSLGAAALGTWHHVAISKSGSTTKIFLNGTQVVADFDMGTHTSSNNFNIGGNLGGGSGGPFTGEISNVRIVQGTAVYTSSFRPSTEPLTNITNTVLLCCNNSSTTGSTVTPGTITSNGGNAAASTDSPFDDPAGFVFGDEGTQNLVKTGSYIGNGSSDGPKVYIGWEPAFLIIRRLSGGTGDWRIFDNMRGLTGDGLIDPFLRSNTADAEQSNLNCVDISPTGFEPKSSNVNWNNTNDKYIYIAIRRSDGLAAKPADAGTDVFAMATGNSNADRGFTSGFPVDWAWYKKPASTHSWYPHSRLTGKQYMHFNTNNAEQTNSWGVWDDNTGWAENTYYDSTLQSWMWKRGQGFDVVTTYGGSGKYVPHSLGRVPEMMILKARNNAQDWRVYHHGVNGGTNPEQYGMVLNSTAGKNQNIGHWHNTAPTATHFRTGTWDSGGANSNYQYIILLFASISGISKCGYYTGNGTGQTITTGFQPRFLIVKRTEAVQNWFVLDTVRGWGSGNDNYLELNDEDAQASYDFGAPTSTGFTLTASGDGYNANGEVYIYYAHA